ncbi:MAG: NAD(P)H-dependent oxidoreductase [Rhodoglobus sp.]
MSKVMILVGSVRPGRAALPVAEWVKGQVQAHGGFDSIDFADLAEINLPFLDEPNHPVLRKYTKPHTFAWSERVDAADAFVLVSPEYNHSLSPVLKNAIDFLSQEWRRKPVGFVSYGGVAAGSRAVVALEPVLSTVGLVKTLATVEIPFISTRIAEGIFTPNEKEIAIFDKQLTELVTLSEALKPLR